MRFIHIADVHLGMQPDAGFPWSEERGEAIWEPESFVRFLKLFFHLPYPAFFPVSFLRQAVS